MGNPMKLAALIFLSLLLVLMVYETFSLLSQKNDVAKKYEELKSALAQTKDDQERLKTEINYLSNPSNLEKELRLRFNLKKPGEKMIIIVPASTSSNP